MKRILFAMAVFLVAFVARAVTPAFQDYSNGTMMYAFPYDANRTGVSVQVRPKADPSAPWATLNGSFSRWNSYSVWTFKTNFVAPLSVQIADVTSSGTGAYDVADDAVCTIAIAGTTLASTSGNPFNGLFDSAESNCAGRDFGRVRRIGKIRYIFRFDSGATTFDSRWGNSVFEIASDASFSDARTVATVTADGYSIARMQEIEFSPPLETRYIRHRSTQGNPAYSSLCECEFISPDLPELPDPTFEPYSPWQTNLIVNWTIPPVYGQLSNVLERARNADGPWTAVTPWHFAGETFAYTDTATKVSLKYCYRVRAYCGIEAYYGQEMLSVVGERYRMRCLERDPADPTVRYPSTVILLDSGESGPGSKGNAFDGNLSNYSESTASSAKIHLGLDFGEPCYFGEVWYKWRPGQSDRAKNCQVWGSNDSENPLADPVALTDGFVCTSETGCGARTAFSPEATAYRYLYAYKNAAWYGNMAEMSFFGWTDADREASGEPKMPQSISALNGEALGDVDLTWGTSVNVLRYDLQCRTKGSSEWSAVKTGLAASSLGCEVTGLTADKWYEFRLAGYDVEENVVYSPTCEVYVYQLVPGAGTGLKSVLYGAQNVLHIATEPTVEVGIWTNVNVDLASGTLFTNASHSTAWVNLLGRIIVPRDGNYTFTLETAGTDGACCSLDGVMKVASGVTAGAQNFTCALTAGEHDFYIGHNAASTRKFLRFRWALANVWGSRVVPTSQFVPAGDADVAPFLPSSFEGWTCSLPPAGVSPTPYVKFLGPGWYETRGAGADFGTGSCVLMTKSVRGPFTFDLEIGVQNGNAGIFVTDDKGNWANCIALIRSSACGMKGNKGDLWSPAWRWESIGACQRLERLPDKTLNFYMKKTTDKEWTLMHTVTQGLWSAKSIDLTGRRLRVGFHTYWSTGATTIRNLRLKAQRGLYLFVR